MRCRSYCWFVSLVIILWILPFAWAQPPTVDSVFVFEGEEGYFTQALPLPSGGFVATGYSIHDNQTFWRVARISAEREILWARDIPAVNSFRKENIALDGESVVGVARILIPADTGSFSIGDIAVKYSLDGDSIWARTFDDSITSVFLNSIIPDGSGGYFVLGNENGVFGPSSNQQVRLTRTNGDGDVLWERFYGRQNHDQAGGIVKLNGDSLLIATVMNFGQDDRVVFLWTSMNGDSLTSQTYGELGTASLSRPSLFQQRDGGWEFVWSDGSNDVPYTTRVHWLQTEYDGTLIRELTIYVPIYFAQGYKQTDDGLMTVGYTAPIIPDRDIVIGRLSGSGQWYYLDTLSGQGHQEGYCFLPLESGNIAVLGRTQVSDTISDACVFYINDSDQLSYLFSMPGEIDFGVVPLHEVEVRDVALAVSWDSSVTVTDIVLPEFIASSLDLPATVMPGESLYFQLGFRPSELTRYADTVEIHSTARNTVLTIPVSGQAPFPECTPALQRINFNWSEIGDSVRRPFAVFNTGTLPLHIDEIIEPTPFYLDNSGPFVIEPDTNALLWITFRPDSVTLYEVNLIFQSDDPQGADTVELIGRGLPGTVDADDPIEAPREIKLHAAYPNPFNASAVLEFELPKTQLVKLDLFDITGRLVKEISRNIFAAGEHRIVIDGAGLASGVYFAKMDAGEFHAVQKLVLLK